MIFVNNYGFVSCFVFAGARYSCPGLDVFEAERFLRFMA